MPATRGGWFHDCRAIPSPCSLPCGTAAADSHFRGDRLRWRIVVNVIQPTAIAADAEFSLHEAKGRLIAIQDDVAPSARARDGLVAEGGKRAAADPEFLVHVGRQSRPADRRGKRGAGPQVAGSIPIGSGCLIPIVRSIHGRSSRGLWPVRKHRLFERSGT